MSDNTQTQKLSQYNLFVFYLPLALTCILMSATHLLFDVALSRLPSPEIMLSSFAISKALMQTFQSPTFSIRTTTSKFSDSAQAYLFTKKFYNIMAIAYAVLFVILAYSPLATIIFKQFYNASDQVTEYATVSLKLLVLFPTMMVIRNHRQGVAIRLNKNPLIASSTVSRFIFVFAFLLLLPQLLKIIRPEMIGSLMFAGGGFCEVIIMLIGLYFIKDIPNILENKYHRNPVYTKSPPLNMKVFLTFYLSMVANSIIATFYNPLINAGLLRCANPEIIVSSYSMAQSVGNILLSPPNMLIQIILVYGILNNKLRMRDIKKFFVILGSFLCIVSIPLGYTKFGTHILQNWVKAPESIIELTKGVLRVYSFFIVIRVIKQYYWGIIIKIGKTQLSIIVKIIGLIIVFIFRFIIPSLSVANPAQAAMTTLLIIDVLEISFYLVYLKIYPKRTQLY